MKAKSNNRPEQAGNTSPTKAPLPSADQIAAEAAELQRDARRVHRKADEVHHAIDKLHHKAEKVHRTARQGLKANYFPIVGIGASAGGLEAMTQLLENLPHNTG